MLTYNRKKRPSCSVCCHITAALALSMVLLTACTDDLPNPTAVTGGDNGDAIAFAMSVSEQAQMAYATTRSSATPSSASAHSDSPTPRTLDGDDGMGLQLHTLTLPLMGIHPGTVREGGTGDQTTETNGTSGTTGTTGKDTRALATDIVQGGSDPLNFHDSLTVWGFTDKGRPLFRQILLKKVSGYRSSVHWPYDNEVLASWSSLLGYAAADNGNNWLNPTTMRFYAIAPSMEGLDIKVDNSSYVGYATPPTFTYTVADDPNQQRDLLYGVSPDIDIQAGPQGTQQYPYADTPKEQHLGQDDKTVALHFQHLLTAVRFAQGKIPKGVTITEIKLTSIVNEGTYHPEQDDNILLPSQIEADKGRWVLAEDANHDYIHTGNYSLKTNKAIQNYTEAENVYIDNGQVLFLMPHIVTAHAQLEVTLTIDLTHNPFGSYSSQSLYGESSNKQTREVTLKTSLEGDVWKKGYTVTYYLSVGRVAEGYYLLADPASAVTDKSATSEQEHSTSSTTGSFTIHSYRHYLDYSNETPDDNGNTPGTSVFAFVPWKVTGFSSTENGEYTSARPSWLQNIPGWNAAATPEEPAVVSTGNSDGKALSVSYSLTPQRHAYTAKHSEVMNRTNPIGDFDLSNKTPNGANGADKTQAETANCYIVNAPGNYKFPAYYGNAYGKTKPSFNPYDIFKDHEGRTITEGNILSQVNHTLESDVDVTTEYNASNSTSHYRVTRTTSVEYDHLKNVSGGYNGDMTAELVWKDTDLNIFSAIQYNGGTNYIQFTLSADNTKGLPPCNAVIALKGKRRVKTTYKVYATDQTTTPTESSFWDTEDQNIASTILWTWHIWVTDEVYANSSDAKATHTSKTSSEEGYQIQVDNIYPSVLNNGSKIPRVTNYSNASCDVLPVNLGWVPDNNEFGIYDHREVWVEIEQTQPTNGEKQKIHLKIEQHAIQDFVTGTSTIYQWGRPTALPSLLKIDRSTARPVFNANNTDISNSFVLAINTAAAEAEAKAITNPKLMYRYGSTAAWMPAAASYWNGSSKTLYDPCPPGFRMPAVSVFTGFSKNGSNATGVANMNAHEKNINKYGDYFYCTANETSRYAPVIYMPATGQWKCDWDTSNSSQLNYVPPTGSSGMSSYINASLGYYWTGSNSGINADILLFRTNPTSDAAIQFDQTLPAGYAVPVRPCGN